MVKLEALDLTNCEWLSEFHHMKLQNEYFFRHDIYMNVSVQFSGGFECECGQLYDQYECMWTKKLNCGQSNSLQGTKIFTCYKDVV